MRGPCDWHELLDHHLDFSGSQCFLDHQTQQTLKVAQAVLAEDLGQEERLLGEQVGLGMLEFDEITGLYKDCSKRHAVAFFELLGGGQRDAIWDGSGISKLGNMRPILDGHLLSQNAGIRLSF